MSAVKNHTVQDDEIDMEDESKTPLGNRKHIFWQPSINDQWLMLRMHTNNIVIEGLLHTGVDVTIITPESWYLN